MYISIRQKVMIIAMVATVVYALSFVLVKTHHLRDMAHEEQRLKLESVAGIYLQFVAQYQHVLTQEATTVATLSVLRDALRSPGAVSRSIDEQLSSSSVRSMSRLLVLATDGELIYGDSIFSNVDSAVTELDGIRQALHGHRYYGTSLIGGKFYQLATAPVLDAGQVIGIVVIAVPVLEVSAFRALSEVTGMEVALQYRNHLLGLSTTMDEALAPGFIEIIPQLSQGLAGQYLIGESAEIDLGGAPVRGPADDAG